MVDYANEERIGGYATQGVDVSDQAMARYLEKAGPVVTRIIKNMEGKEPMAADASVVVADQVTEFCRQLSKEDLQELADVPDSDLVIVLGYISVTRYLMLMEHLTASQDDPEATQADIIMGMEEAATGDEHAKKAFKQCVTRLLHLERMRCLDKIYGARRARRMLRALIEVIS